MTFSDLTLIKPGRPGETPARPSGDLGSGLEPGRGFPGDACQNSTCPAACWRSHSNTYSQRTAKLPIEKSTQPNVRNCLCAICNENSHSTNCQERLLTYGTA